MAIDVSDYEKLGAFYLGKNYDPQTKSIGDELVLYDSKDLVTHGVVLGMTGSGKTGLCIGILEEAAMDNIPAIVIDPKGDIANLMLTFPDLKGSDFQPWIHEDEALKKGLSPADHAEKTARMWEKGLADWGQSADRLRQFREKTDINIFTPGSNAGIPVSILSSLEVPPFEVMDDGEMLGERIESTVSSLLSLVSVKADPIQSPEAILLGTIFYDQWKKEQSLSLESLIRHIQKPPFGKVGVIDVESFMSAKARQDLALKFNALLASPSFATWLEGPPLDIQKMMFTDEGKPRISIFSIAHLSDSERMFFVSLLLNQMLGWMRSQGGTTSLRALLYMDEIFGFLPPSANPPSKKPMMTMLKQARAFGLGVLLATQNPVDLDYKALSNIGTWWLGRLQTERDKMRVLDGLESASNEQGGGFKRVEIEKMLSGLSGRVFLMNNVHENGPVVMHVRWVMSYLCGPLQRRQIKTLMDPKRDLFLSPKNEIAAANPMSMADASAPAIPKGERPVVAQGVSEYFAPVAGEAENVTYRPTLLREAEVHFSSSKAGLEGSRLLRFVNPIEAKKIDFDEDLGCTIPLRNLLKKPQSEAGFANLPGFAMNADNYKTAEKEFSDWIYRQERVELFHASLYGMYSKLGESEGDFRARLALKGREARDAAVDKLRGSYASKLRTKQSQLERAAIALDKEKTQASSATWKAGASILGGLLGGLLGGRKSSRSLTTGAGRVFDQRQDVRIAKDRMELIEREYQNLEEELRLEIETLEAQYDPNHLIFDREIVKPYKKDIVIIAAALLWLPFDEEGKKAW